MSYNFTNLRTAFEKERAYLNHLAEGDLHSEAVIRQSQHMDDLVMQYFYPDNVGSAAKPPFFSEKNGNALHHKDN